MEEKNTGKAIVTILEIIVVICAAALLVWKINHMLL